LFHKRRRRFRDVHREGEVVGLQEERGESGKPGGQKG